MDDNARTQAVPSLDDLLQQDRVNHAERGGVPMPEGEDEDVAAPTEAIDFAALVAAGAVPDPAAVIDKHRAAENLATTPLDDGPHPVASPASGGMMSVPESPSSAGDSGGDGGWEMGGPAAAAPMADEPAPPPPMGGGGGGMDDMGGGGGGGMAPPPEPEAKSNKGLIIGVVVGLVFVFCCCPLVGLGGWQGYAYYTLQDTGVDLPTSVDGEPAAEGSEAGEGGEGGDAAGGSITSLTADGIKKVLEDEGYTVPTDPITTDAGGAKSIALSGLKDTTAVSVIFYSYDGPGADIAMESWKKSAEGIDGSHVIVDGNAGLQVTVIGNADEAKRLAGKITGG